MILSKKHLDTIFCDIQRCYDVYARASSYNISNLSQKEVSEINFNVSTRSLYSTISSRIFMSLLWGKSPLFPIIMYKNYLIYKMIKEEGG